MKNIIIAGANGMIGNIVLKECLKRTDVEKVTTITRIRTGLDHPKLIEVIHNDFSDFSDIKEYFKNQQFCFYCLGVYTGQVSKEEFHKITVDFTKAFAEELRRNNEKTVFCFLSGEGADSTEKSRIMFARDKGIAENILLNLNFYKTFIFRPGYIYPVIPRKEPNFMYRLLRVLYKPISFFFPGIGVTSELLANKMIEIGMNGREKIFYNNNDIRKWTKQ